MIAVCSHRLGTALQSRSLDRRTGRGGRPRPTQNPYFTPIALYRLAVSLALQTILRRPIPQAVLPTGLGDNAKMGALESFREGEKDERARG